MKSSLAWFLVTLVLLGLAWAIPPDLGFFLGMCMALLFPIPVLVSTRDPKRALLLAPVGFLSFFVELSMTVTMKQGSLTPAFLAGLMCLANAVSVGSFTLLTWLVQVGFLSGLCLLYSTKHQGMFIHPVLLVLGSASVLIFSAIPGRGKERANSAPLALGELFRGQPDAQKSLSLFLPVVPLLCSGIFFGVTSQEQWTVAVVMISSALTYAFYIQVCLAFNWTWLPGRKGPGPGMVCKKPTVWLRGLLPTFPQDFYVVGWRYIEQADSAEESGWNRGCLVLYLLTLGVLTAPLFRYE